MIDTLELAMGGNYFWHNKQFSVHKRDMAMGAKYAPTIANVFVSKWEADYIYNRRKPKLKVYQRYIDDIFVVWEGSEATLK